MNYIGLGGKKHIFELGGGFTVLAVGAGASAGFGADTTSGSNTSIIGHLNLGYRMQPPQGGFMMRAGSRPSSAAACFCPGPISRSAQRSNVAPYGRPSLRAPDSAGCLAKSLTLFGCQ